MKEKLGHSRRKTGHKFGIFSYHPTSSLAVISLEDDMCGYFQDYQQLSALVILFAPRGTLSRIAGWCRKQKNTDNLFDYQCFSKEKFVLQVELEGVEPSSKQLTEKLSTCLSGDWFSCW